VAPISEFELAFDYFIGNFILLSTFCLQFQDTLRCNCNNFCL